MDIAKHLEEQISRENARRAFHDQDAERHRGVCWSGMAPGPFVPKTGRDLIAAAEASAQREADYLASAKGKAEREAIAQRRKVEVLHQAAQAVENALSRGDGSARKAQAEFERLAKAVVSDSAEAWLAIWDVEVE